MNGLDCSSGDADAEIVPTVERFCELDLSARRMLMERKGERCERLDVGRAACCCKGPIMQVSGIATRLGSGDLCPEGSKHESIHA